MMLVCCWILMMIFWVLFLLFLSFLDLLGFCGIQMKNGRRLCGEIGNIFFSFLTVEIFCNLFSISIPFFFSIPNSFFSCYVNLQKWLSCLPLSPKDRMVIRQNRYCLFSIFNKWIFTITYLNYIIFIHQTFVP